MSKFFIDRPIFAWVIAIVLMMVGALAVVTLPVAQYPSIAPPAVAITVVYPGASADTVQSTVVQPIEQQLSGLDHLLYFSSESDKDGSMTITLSFDQGRRWCTRQTQGELALNPSRYAMSGWRRTESGRPAANIRFSTTAPMAASVCWAAKPRARIRGPISNL